MSVMGFFISKFSFFRSKPVADMSAKASEVKELIASDKVVIFSKTYCPYCKLAKEVKICVIFYFYCKYWIDSKTRVVKIFFRKCPYFI